MSSHVKSQVTSHAEVSRMPEASLSLSGCSLEMFGSFMKFLVSCCYFPNVDAKNTKLRVFFGLFALEAFAESEYL